MRTMSGSPCRHYDCSNRNSFGYCKTTVCINEHYQREQWGSPSTTNKSESVVIKPQTNADRIRAMTDEELAEFITPVKCVDCRLLDCGVEEEMLNGKRRTCQERVLDWLKEEGE